MIPTFEWVPLVSIRLQQIARVGVGASCSHAGVAGPAQPPHPCLPPPPSHPSRSFKGRRFHISRTTLFNVEAPTGEVVGQAVTIRAWEYEDGTKVGGGQLV
jgi:hypothetical protein